MQREVEAHETLVRLDHGDEPRLGAVQLDAGERWDGHGAWNGWLARKSSTGPVSCRDGVSIASQDLLDPKVRLNEADPLEVFILIEGAIVEIESGEPAPLGHIPIDASALVVEAEVRGVDGRHVEL